MYRFFSSIRHGRVSSRLSLLAPKPLVPSSLPRLFPQNYEHVRGFSSGNWSWRRNNLSQNENQNVNPRPDSKQDIQNIIPRFLNNQGHNANANANANARPDLKQDMQNRIPRFLNNQGHNANANAHARPDFMKEGDDVNSRRGNDAEAGWNSRPMDFVRGIIEEDNILGGPSGFQYEQDADFVHIKMLRNNTFVTVTDNKGNIKLSGSVGSLKDMKTGQKLSRYAAEATAEVVGRRSRGLGLKSVVMKVNGFTHFRRKRQAIMSWREGFADSRGDKNPIVYIEDTTRKPHNGCRLPKKRRI